VALLALGERQVATAAFDRAEAASEEVGDAAGVVLAGLGRATIAQIDGDSVSPPAAVRGGCARLTRLGTPLWGGHALAGVAWCDWRDELLDDVLRPATRVARRREQLRRADPLVRPAWTGSHA
jgi:hypothetical protein